MNRLELPSRLVVTNDVYLKDEIYFSTWTERGLALAEIFGVVYPMERRYTYRLVVDRWWSFHDIVSFLQEWGNATDENDAGPPLPSGRNK